MLCWLKKLLWPRRHGSCLTGRLRVRVRDASGKILRELPLVKNGDTTVGLNDMLSVYFDSGTQKTSWYMGLISNVGFTAVASSNTISSHSGWSESSAYSETTRPQWSPDAPSAGVISGPSVTFTMNATIAIKGIFVVSESTKAGTTGVLFATALFSSVDSLTSGQVLDVTYEKSLTPN